MVVGIAQRALADSRYCGDQCAYWRIGPQTTLCMVDGVGHGKDAQKAAMAALDYVAEHLSRTLVDVFEGCDAALDRTRGVVMGIAVVDDSAGKLTYAAVGDTSAILVGTKSVMLQSAHGIVGDGYRGLRVQSVEVRAGDLMVMHTDGVRNADDTASYVQMTQRDVQEIAEQIMKERMRGDDDAAVLVYRIGAF